MKKQHTKMDLLILAAVIALIAGVFVKGWALRRTAVESISFTYQMELIDPESGIADAIIPGDTVICEAGKQPVGIVVDVQTDGGLVVVTIQANGYPIDGGYRTNVYDILPGFRQRFYTDTAYWKGIITSFPEVMP